MKTFYLPIKIYDANDFLDGTEYPIETAFILQAYTLRQDEKGLAYASNLEQAEAMLREKTLMPPTMGRDGVGSTLSEYLTQPPAGVIFEVEVTDDIANSMAKETNPMMGDIYRGFFGAHTIQRMYSIVGADPLHDTVQFVETYDASGIPPKFKSLHDELAQRMPALERLQDSIEEAPAAERRDISLISQGIKYTFAPNGLLDAPDDVLTFGDRMCRDVLNALAGEEKPELAIADKMYDLRQKFLQDMGAGGNISPEEYSDCMDVVNTERIINALQNMLKNAKDVIPERFGEWVDALQQSLICYVEDRAEQEMSIDETEIDD